MQKAMILALVMFSVGAEGLLIEGLQAAEEPTFWDMGDTNGLEKYADKLIKNGKSMRADVKNADEMDYDEKIKAVAGGLLKDKAATTEEQRKAEELADVPTLVGKSMKELAQEQLAKKPVPATEKEQKAQKKADTEKELKIAAKEKELQELTAGNHKKSQLAAAEQELQDLYKEQLEELIPHHKSEEAKHKTDRKKTQAQHQLQEQQREAKIAAMADERLADVKEAVAPAEKLAGGKKEQDDKYQARELMREEKMQHEQEKVQREQQLREEKRQAKQQKTKEKEAQHQQMLEQTQLMKDQAKQQKMEEKARHEQQRQEEERLAKIKVQDEQIEKYKAKLQMQQEKRQAKQQLQEEKTQHKQQLQMERLQAKQHTKEQLQQAKIDAKEQMKVEKRRMKHPEELVAQDEEKTAGLDLGAIDADDYGAI